MSDQYSQQPNRTTVPDPHTAGLPAENACEEPAGLPAKKSAGERTALPPEVTAGPVPPPTDRTPTENQLSATGAEPPLVSADGDPPGAVPPPYHRCGRDGAATA